MNAPTPLYVSIFCLGDSEPVVRDHELTAVQVSDLQERLRDPNDVLTLPRPQVGGYTLIPVRAVAAVYVDTLKR